MPSQRGVVEMQGSNSSNSLVEHQVYWNNMLHQIVDHQEIGEFVLSPGDSNFPFTNGSSRESGNFDGWNFTNPVSSGTATNPINLEEAKSDQEWNSSPLSNPNTISRLHDGIFEVGNVLLMENVDVNSNSNQVPGIQECDAHQTSGVNTEFVCATGQLLLNSCGHETLRSEPLITPVNSSDTCATNRCNPEDTTDGRLQSSLNCQRIAGKRKVIEVENGQACSSGDMKHFHKGESSQQIVSVENNLNGTQSILNSFMNNGTEVQLPSMDDVGRAVTQESQSSVTRPETTRRSVRRRISPSPGHSAFLPSLWGSDSIAHTHIWQPTPPPSLPASFIQFPDVGMGAPIPFSQAQSSIPTIPSLPQASQSFLWNGLSSSHTRTSPSLPSASGGRLPSRRVARSIPLPVTDIRHLPQDPTNWNMSLGSIGSIGQLSSYSRIGSGSYPTSPLLPSSHFSHGRHPLRLSDNGHQSFASLDSGPQNNNTQLQDLNHPNSPQEIIRNLGTVSRGQQRQIIRSALLLDRENEIFGVPLPLRIAALRDGRSRLISEVRSALDDIRRGDNPVFFGGVDLHDRHRDMRLDVDNMSYEELLALEERIGNVSTGLTEETVSKHLKQLKYTSNATERSEYVEPCCVCQEEYVEGEDLGSLDCGHNFHSKCIKKWLSHKNLCPICKKTVSPGTRKMDI